MCGIMITFLFETAPSISKQRFLPVEACFWILSEMVINMDICLPSIFTLLSLTCKIGLQISSVYGRAYNKWTLFVHQMSE